MTKSYDKIQMYISALRVSIKANDTEQGLQVYHELKNDKDINFNGLPYLLQVWNHLVDELNILLENA